MSFKPITPLPVPPTTADSASFEERADAFLSSLPLFGIEQNAFIADLNGLMKTLSNYESDARLKLDEHALTLIEKIKSQLKALVDEGTIRLQASGARSHSTLSFLAGEILSSLERLHRSLSNREKIGQYSYFAREKIPLGYAKSGEIVSVLSYPIAWRILAKAHKEATENAPDGYFYIPIKSPINGFTEAVYLGR